jgi:DNA excision repair protein ERCC-4
VHVRVDDREPLDSIIPYLRSIEGITVEVSRLPVGDYEVDDRLIFERKTLFDFAASLVQGRLFKQACRLAGAAQQGIYILEGSTTDLGNMGVRREAIQGAMITLSVVMGLPILRSLNLLETSRLINYCADQVDRIGAIGLSRQGYRPKGKLKRQMFLLQGLPGVGPERARRLLTRFGCVEKVVTADEKSLAEIDGIGDSTARRIRWAVA